MRPLGGPGGPSANPAPSRIPAPPAWSLLLPSRDPVPFQRNPAEPAGQLWLEAPRRAPQISGETSVVEQGSAAETMDRAEMQGGSCFPPQGTRPEGDTLESSTEAASPLRLVLTQQEHPRRQHVHQRVHRGAGRRGVGPTGLRTHVTHSARGALGVVSPGSRPGGGLRAPGPTRRAERSGGAGAGGLRPRALPRQSRLCGPSVTEAPSACGSARPSLSWHLRRAGSGNQSVSHGLREAFSKALNHRT